MVWTMLLSILSFLCKRLYDFHGIVSFSKLATFPGLSSWMRSDVEGPVELMNA